MAQKSGRLPPRGVRAPCCLPQGLFSLLPHLGHGFPAEAQVIARETGAHLNTAAGQFTMQGFEEQSETIRAATLQAYGAACTFLREGFHSVLQYVRKRLKPMTEDES